MKKNIFITFLLFIFIRNIDVIMSSVKSGSLLFFNKVFISTFPFMILSDILFYFDYHLFISNSFIGKFISKIFNLNQEETTVFIFSILSSQPNNAVYIKKLLDDNIIDVSLANKLLIFTYFPSISFVIGSVGIIIFNSLKIGLFLYLNAILNNILICFYLRNKTNVICCFKNNKKDSLISTIKNSIIKAFNNSYIILGNLIIFSILINLIKKYLNNSFLILIISSLVEVTNALDLVSNLKMNFIFKLFISSFSINFSGLSILFQSISILGDYKLDIKKILIIKLIFSLLSSSLCIFYFLII